jgi:hypothetical protein
LRRRRSIGNIPNIQINNSTKLIENQTKRKDSYSPRKLISFKNDLKPMELQKFVPSRKSLKLQTSVLRKESTFKHHNDLASQITSSKVAGIPLLKFIQNGGKPTKSLR